MKKYSLSFLTGNLLLHQFSDIQTAMPTLLIAGSVFSIIVLIFLIHYISAYRDILVKICLLIGFCVGGFSLALVSAEKILATSLPTELENREIIVQGYIDSIPIVKQSSSKFNFIISQINADKTAQFLNAKVRLSWYQLGEIEGEEIKVGQLWQLKVKLKKPSGFMNPGGFDYERWLFQQQLRASGYVRKGIENQRLSTTIAGKYYWDHLRQNFASDLRQQLQGLEFKGLILALVLGIKSDLDSTTWKVFLDSGTNHLIAISGLHIGLFAGIGFFLGRRLWSFFPQLLKYYPAQQAGALVAILFALIYAALAGFSIPTQRALIMLVIALSGMILRRHIPIDLILSLTLLLVLLLDPLSSLSAGFWLSFFAVAVILFYVLNHARKQASDNSIRGAKITQKIENKSWASNLEPLKARFFQVSTIPLVVFVGLLPISLLFFERFSLLSPIANLLAVPWMSLTVIPLSLLAALVSLFSLALAGWIFNLVELCMQPLWALLKVLVSSQYNLFYPPSVSIFWVGAAIFGVGCLLNSRLGKKRALGLILFIPLFIPQFNSIAEGQFKLTTLDVGQGLSVLLQTKEHLLIYDTGNAYSERFNMADQVIIPYMRHYGLDKIDTLLLSHADDDHMGAANILKETFPPENILTGEVGRLKAKLNIDAQQCLAGQEWQWDGVSFKVLSPLPELLKNKKMASNNRSCILLVRSANGFSVLLTGDAERRIEQKLQQQKEIKDIDVLIVGHHGSSSSSSQTFLQWLKPKIAVFTYGYNNRYHFPAEDVMQRFYAQGSLLYATINGTIDIDSNMSNNAAQIKEYRRDHRQYWNRAHISLNKL